MCKRILLDQACRCCQTQDNQERLRGSVEPEPGSNCDTDATMKANHVARPVWVTILHQLHGKQCLAHRSQLSYSELLLPWLPALMKLSCYPPKYFLVSPTMISRN